MGPGNRDYTSDVLGVQMDPDRAKSECFSHMGCARMEHACLP